MVAMKGSSRCSAPKSGAASRAPRHNTASAASPTTTFASTQDPSTAGSCKGISAMHSNTSSKASACGATVKRAIGAMRPSPSHRPARLGASNSTGAPSASIHNQR